MAAITIREFFEKQRGSDGRAILAPACWIDQHGQFLRLHTPQGVELVSADDNLAALLQTLRVTVDGKNHDDANSSAQHATAFAGQGGGPDDDISHGVADSNARRAASLGQQQTMKALLWIATIPALAVGYYFGIALPSYNEASLTLERQRYSDVQAKQADEAKKAQQDAAERQKLLNACFQAADDAYWIYVKLNGTEHKDGRVQASMNIWNTADRRKSEDRDICLKRYPTR